jgi:hypothetical protein
MASDPSSARRQIALDSNAVSRLSAARQLVPRKIGASFDPLASVITEGLRAEIATMEDNIAEERILGKKVLSSAAIALRNGAPAEFYTEQTCHTKLVPLLSLPQGRGAA